MLPSALSVGGFHDLKQSTLKDSSSSQCMWRKTRTPESFHWKRQYSQKHEPNKTMAIISLLLLFLYISNWAKTVIHFEWPGCLGCSNSNFIL